MLLKVKIKKAPEVNEKRIPQIKNPQRHVKQSVTDS